MLLKLAGLGTTEYVSSGWNCVDGAVVIVGWIEVALDGVVDGILAIRCVEPSYLPSTLSLPSHRAFRAVRPLRSVNKLPQLRLIVNTLLAAIPQLLHVMLLSALIYCVLGLAALQVPDMCMSSHDTLCTVQMWVGNTHQRCYADMTGSIYMTASGDLYLCSPQDNAVVGALCITHPPHLSH